MKHPATLHHAYLKAVDFQAKQTPFSAETFPAPHLTCRCDCTLLDTDKNYYEVVLTIQLSAKTEANPVYTLTLVQAGLFELPQLDQTARLRILRVHCPEQRYLFAQKAIHQQLLSASLPLPVLPAMDFEQIAQEKKETTHKTTDALSANTWLKIKEEALA